MPQLPRLTSLAISLALLSGSFACLAAEAPPAKAQTEAGAKGILPLDDLRTFAEVFDRIKNAYVEPVDDKTLLENAIKGMLSNLDPHSAYLGPEDFRDLQESTSGEFSGIGIEVGMVDGMFQVVAPIDDTPAAAAGIESGDLRLVGAGEIGIRGADLLG